MKTESASHWKKGKREYLTYPESKILLDELSRLFETKVEVKRIRNGDRQTLETLINEEALLFAKYLINELSTWNPRNAFLKKPRL